MTLMTPTIAALSAIEKRVLAYLDQHGPTHRTNVVCDLASPDSSIGKMGGRHNGSNGATPLIMGKWCSRLIKAGLVQHRTAASGYYQDHAITSAGRTALRQHLLEGKDA